MKSKSFKGRTVGIVFGMFFACLAATVFAGGNDHERALQAMQAGDIKPLSEILAALSANQAGRVLEVELEEKRGRWVYEFKLLDPKGTLREIKVDARTGEIFGSNHRD